ncbi:hypothetical protein JL722_992 [Aureococcus anophagefferens]|nr:hypothetical protein JL722_992 [Aureococcus anophagefferens]
MVRTLILALALSATDGFAPATKGIQRVAPMNMETMPYSSPAAQSSSGPLGLGPRESPKNAPGADSTILVQGGSLRTWSYKSPLVNQVQVVLSTEGRPLDADLELWHGPDNTPCKMRVYVENGQLRPFSCVIATPRGPNTVAIRTSPDGVPDRRRRVPMTAAAGRDSIDDKMASGAFDGDVVIGGDIGW